MHGVAAPNQPRAALLLELLRERLQEGVFPLPDGPRENGADPA